MVVHVEGATRPGSPNEPEYIKANVYFPGHMVREEPYTSNVVSDIVQRFIRNIGIRPLSALIDAPDYSGTHPCILAQSQHHILCKSPHPLPRLQAPVCLPIMGSRIEPQWSIPTQTTRTNTNQQVLSPKTLHSGPDSSNSTSLSLALHLIHIQSHLPTPKGPCLLSY